jgi:hypothetical protein
MTNILSVLGGPACSLPRHPQRSTGMSIRRAAFVIDDAFGGNRRRDRV